MIPASPGHSVMQITHMTLIDHSLSQSLVGTRDVIPRSGCSGARISHFTGQICARLRSGIPIVWVQSENFESRVAFRWELEVPAPGQGRRFTTFITSDENRMNPRDIESCEIYRSCDVPHGTLMAFVSSRNDASCPVFVPIGVIGERHFFILGGRFCAVRGPIRGQIV